MAHIVIQHVIAHGLLSRLLIFTRDGGVNAVAIFIRLLAITVDHLLADHLTEIRRGEGDFRCVVAGVNGFTARLIVLRLRDIAFVQHTCQNNITTRGRAVYGIERVKRRGCFRQAGDNGHFAQAKLVDGFTKVNLRRRADAIGAVAEIDFIQIQLKDFVFIQQLFDANRQEGFFNLTHQRLLWAQEEVTR